MPSQHTFGRLNACEVQEIRVKLRRGEGETLEGEFLDPGRVVDEHIWMSHQHNLRCLVREDQRLPSSNSTTTSSSAGVTSKVCACAGAGAATMVLARQRPNKSEAIMAAVLVRWSYDYWLWSSLTPWRYITAQAISVSSLLLEAHWPGHKPRAYGRPDAFSLTTETHGQ